MITTLILAALIQIPDRSQTGPHVADVRAFKGAVTLDGAASGPRAPQRFGCRIRNKSIFDEDQVSTAAGATCTTVFPDSTTVTLQPNSQVQILQKHLTKPTAEGANVQPPL